MENKNSIQIAETAVMAAASEGMDAFLKLFADRYAEVLGDVWTPETMAQLNASQMSILVYSIFRNEVMDGGFVQLIHNGYGPLVFENPFAKTMKLWGLADFSKLVYNGSRLYRACKDELTRDYTDDEFMALFEQHSEFDDLDDAFVLMEEEVTAALASYMDEHLTDFAEIVKP